MGTTNNNQQNEYSRTPEEMKVYIQLFRIKSGFHSYLRDNEKGHELAGYKSVKNLIFHVLNRDYTTMDALALALEIELAECEKYLAELLNEGKLLQSVYKIKCPFRGKEARLLSTDPTKVEMFRDMANPPKTLF